MSNDTDKFNILYEDMPKSSKKETEKFYKDQLEYHHTVTITLSKTLLNWIFLLNTGGLALTITFMGSFQHAQDIKKPLVRLIMIFSVGIISIFISAMLEKRFSNERMRLLYTSFTKFVCNEITRIKFINYASPNYFRNMITIFSLEALSCTSFFTGLICAIKLLSRI